MNTFNPGFFLKNRHIQTLYPALFRKKIALDMEIENFELDDGDFLECFWFNKKQINARKKIVVLFHGLEGSHNSPYIQGIMQALKKEKYTSVLMHFRGCSGKINKTPYAYHSGDTKDALAWLSHIKKEYKTCDIYCIAYSMGGNMLLKLLGENNPNVIKAAVSVCAPLQLEISAKSINQGFARIYQKHLLKRLIVSLENKYEHHDMQAYLGIQKKEVKKIKSIEEFDDVYTAKMYGFASAKEYYERCSARQFLKNIKIPTLIIQALDDPFMKPSNLPKTEELSSSIKLELYEKGGHVGFIEGSIFNPKYFLEKRIINYLTNNN